MNTKSTSKTLFLSLLVALQMTNTVYASGVIINGQLLSYAEKTAIEKQIGARIQPGNYVSDGDCWVNMSNGASGCLSSGTVNHFSRYGSGERNNQGAWNHWSNLANGGVGGTSDGCIYTTFGYSNC